VNDLERRLIFFRWHSIEGFPVFDPAACAKAIRALPDDVNRKVPRGEFAADVLVQDVGGGHKPTLLSLLRLRDFENRPWLRAPGETAHPAQMRRDEDLIDFAQVAIWSDGYAAFAQGGHAPPPSGLVDFCARRVDQAVHFAALFERDVVQRMRSWKGIRTVNLLIQNSRTVQEQINARIGPFEGFLSQLRGQPDGVFLRHEIAVPKRGRGARSRVLAAINTDDVIRLAEVAESFDAFTVSGITSSGRIEKVDLIRQRLQVETRLPRSPQGGHRTDDVATFQALIAARGEVERDGRLATAAEATLPSVEPE
jgi:hypothetical protein